MYVSLCVVNFLYTQIIITSMCLGATLTWACGGKFLYCFNLTANNIYVCIYILIKYLKI